MMKTWVKVLIGIGSTILVLGAIIVITIFTEISWILFGLISALTLIIWVVIGTIMIYAWIKRKKPITETLNLEETIKMAKYQISHNEDNPDNFIVQESEIHREGEPGSERDVIRVLHGKGTETLQKITFIVNLQDPKENTDLRDASKEKIDLMIKKISRRQESQEVSETIPGGVDAYGNILPPRTRVIRATQSQIKKEAEIKEAEEQTAY